MSPMWWQTGTIYQIYPRSFQDSNGDGIGDLEGIRQRLDYLAWLGVDAIWISPVYPSPMHDFGYDVTDYCGIDPIFGSLESFDRLIEEAHQKAAQNHPRLCSKPHVDRTSLVQSQPAVARRSETRLVYLADAAPDGGPPNNWISNFGGSTWAWDAGSGQ